MLHFCLFDINNNNCFTGFVATNITANITIPTQLDAVPVMSVFGWIIIHQRLGFTFNWNLPCDDYKAGFGSIGADFWLGLEIVHLLTNSQPYRLRVEMQQWSTNLWFSAEYWSFQIGDKYWSFQIGDELNDKYRLEVSGYSGDAGDSLQYEGDFHGDGLFGYYECNGRPFTTYDRDNDMSWFGNCASMYDSGWWYNACYFACLTCKLGNNGWWSLPYPYVNNSRMMIKPQ